MQTITVERREIHLAAYMKTQGASLVKAGPEFGFIFETDRSLNDWRVEHSNSLALAVDRELLTLKRFLS